MSNSKISLIIIFLFFADICQAQLPPKEKTLDVMEKTNAYFMNKWEDPGKEITIHKTWPSNIWTRAVYYEGLMALYSIDPKQEYYRYAVDWANAHEWNFRDGILTRNADNQCAGQTYLDLYEIEPNLNRAINVKASFDSMLITEEINDWDWIDAVQMEMPVLAQLGRIYKDDKYFDRMYEMYNHTKELKEITECIILKIIFGGGT